MSVAKIIHFSDLLCVWAFVAQRRVDELVANFGDAVELEYHYFGVFGSVRRKLEQGWATRGGPAGYRDHVASLAAQFDHVKIHPKVWVEQRPESSMPCHLFLSALRGPAPEEIPRVAARLRQAFFCEARDISSRGVQLAVAEELGLERAPIEAELDSGRAHAHLDDDLELARELGVRVSPSVLLNEGRQRLIGNVGYRVLEANVRELLQKGESAAQASWC